MDQPFANYYEDLLLLSDCLEKGIEGGWSHELRKQILLLIYKLKYNSRKLANNEIEAELVAIEVTLGYGSGSNNEPNAAQVEDHQLRLLELAESSDEISRSIEENSSNEDEVIEDEVIEDEIEEEVEKAEVEDEIEEVETAQTENEVDHVQSAEAKSESNPAKIQLVLSNCPGRDAARKLANGLVSARLAACVNIIANIGAIYWWKGEIKDTAECQLQIKTSNQSLDEVIDFIKQNHPHEAPEIIAIPVDKGNKDYFDWVKEETYDRR